MRRLLLALVLLLALFFGLLPTLVDRALNRVAGPPPPAPSARARALFAQLRVVDLHADSLLWQRDLDERLSHGQVDLPRLAEGNVALQVFGQFASYGSAVPATAVTVFGLGAQLHRSGLRWSFAPAAFTLGILGWVLGGITAVVASTIGVLPPSTMLAISGTRPAKRSTTRPISSIDCGASTKSMSAPASR